MQPFCVPADTQMRQLAMAAGFAHLQSVHSPVWAFCAIDISKSAFRDAVSHPNTVLADLKSLLGRKLKIPSIEGWGNNLVYPKEVERQSPARRRVSEGHVPSLTGRRSSGYC